MSAWVCAAGLGLLVTTMPAESAGPVQVDVAIVLAVDVSDSTDLYEIELQRRGYAAALRHPGLLAAITSGNRGRIGLSYFEWSGQPHAESLITWRQIGDSHSADSFAAEIESLPLPIMGPGRIGTSISRAIIFGADQISTAGFFVERGIIDVSGDGQNNIGPSLQGARTAALVRGIVINGLPVVVRSIENAKDLPGYYRACVIGGVGSFVLPVVGREQLALAIRRKLILEISAAVPPPVLISASQNAFDCTS